MRTCDIIGISDNRNQWFPPEVLQVIQGGHVFSGGRRHHELVAPLLPADAVWIDITVPLVNVFKQYEVVEHVVIFASGDPLFFGFANTVQREMPEAEIRLFPSFNSLQMLAHRLLLPYHDLRVVSLTGRPWPEFDRALIERAPKIGVLTDREHTPAAIARRMLDYGYTYYTMHIGEHLGNPDLERVTTLSIAEAAPRTFASPNCLLLCTSTPTSPALPNHPRLSTPTSPSLPNYPLLSVGSGSATAISPLRPFGLPDSSFALLDGREKMITKMPIRLLTLQALDLPRRHVLWDIGFCTGSVSIEARLLFPHLHVVAFEIRPECEALIRQNARRHGAPGIEVHMGDFCALCNDVAAPVSHPDAAYATVPIGSPTGLLPSFPAPDAIFIGGHGGKLREIMTQAASALLPGGVIVMNSVTSTVVDRLTGHRPSSRQLFDEACVHLGLQQEAPIHIQLDDYNPIEILKATKAS